MLNFNQAQWKRGIISELPKCNEDWHIYEWLDLLVHFTLDPKNRLVDSITNQDEAQIENILGKESLKLRALIQQQIFSAHTQNEAELFARNYHVSLTTMLAQAFKNLERISDHQTPAGRITLLLIQLFEELVTLIEGRFSMYLSLDEYVPKTYFHLVQKELSSRIQKLKSKISINNPQKVPLEIIVNKFNRFLNTNEFEYTTSYKKIFYKKKLLTEVEKINFIVVDFQGYTALDAMLIYLNFNSVEYINYLISFIKKRVSILQTLSEKTKELYFLYKSFNQLHKRSDIAYNQKFQSIDLIMTNWFNQELAYFEKINTADTSQTVTDVTKIEGDVNSTNHKPKIICTLSSDQIGIILRAAADQKVIVAKSISEVFKIAIPHLSTSAKETLSHDGVRSKAYAAEERDKRFAIAALEQVINKIKEY